MRWLPSSWSRFPDTEHDEGENRPKIPRKRLYTWIGAAVGVLVLLGGIAAWITPKLMRRLESRSVREAREYLQQQDYRRAELTLEQAAQDNPADFDARRELAHFYEAAASSRALSTWRDLIRDEPGNDENRLGLALSAFKLNDLASAREALAGVGAATRRGIEYNQIAAALALRTGDGTAFSRDVEALARMEPDNPHAQFNEAMLELKSGEPSRVATGRAKMLELARTDSLRIGATLQLIDDATRRGGLTVYSDLANQLIPRGSRLPTSDWLAPTRTMYDLIQYMERQPKPAPQDAALLADWLRGRGLAFDATLWLDTLDPSVKSDLAVVRARIACQVQTRDWHGVEAGVRAGGWGRVPPDAITLAFAARIQRERLHPDHANETWLDAIQASELSPEGLRVLLRLSQALGWPDQAVETLWALTRAEPRNDTSWRALAIDAAARGATPKLLEVYEGWSKAMPEDAFVQGVRMWVEVLLGRAVPDDLASAAKSGPVAAAAYALALRGAGRIPEANAALAGLTAANLKEPRVALIRALLLADAGRRGESADALAIPKSGPLLPEERALVGEAERENGNF